MANKRQRLARKRFGAGSDASIASNTSQKRTTQTKKRPQSERDEQHDDSTAEAQTLKKPKHKHTKPFQTIKKKKLTKHPLRVPGKKPGEGCFICNSADHIAKHCPQKLAKDRKKGGSCKECGGVTHLAKDCPQKSTANLSGARHVKLQISKEPAPLSKRIVFGSGDDLQDDFTSCGNDMEEEMPRTIKGQKGKPLTSQAGSPSLRPFVKKPGRSSVKVVDFK